jgi:hypothetical protein
VANVVCCAQEVHDQFDVVRIMAQGLEARAVDRTNVNEVSHETDCDGMHACAHGNGSAAAQTRLLRNTQQTCKMCDGAEQHHSQVSSRSHCVLTLYVDGVNEVTGTRSFGKLHLVDLAGSERLKVSLSTGAMRALPPSVRH